MNANHTKRNKQNTFEWIPTTTIIIVILITTISCTKQPENIIVGLQPIEKNEQETLDTIATSIKKFYGFSVKILKSVGVPENFQVHEGRFRADSMIRYLRDSKPDTIDYIIGITSLDISSTKRVGGEIKKPENRYRDWGVFGLGFRPGESCIVSTFKLSTGDKRKKTERIVKVALHELGHNLGLPHCPSEKCFMRDANESIKTIDQESSELCRNAGEK